MTFTGGVGWGGACPGGGAGLALGAGPAAGRGRAEPTMVEKCVLCRLPAAMMRSHSFSGMLETWWEQVMAEQCREAR